MKRNTTIMTFAKGTMTIFLAILCIHFLGFLSFTSQISDVDRLQKGVSATKISLGHSIGDLETLHSKPLDTSISAINKSPDKKKGRKHPFVVNDARPSREPIIELKKPDLENPFSGIKVLEYWAPAKFHLHASQPKEKITPFKDEGEVKRDSMHISLFSNILQIALNENEQERIFEENIDSNDIFLLVQNKDLPLSSKMPPERQLDPTVQLNGTDHSITAVLRANDNESYILIVCTPAYIVGGKNILQLNIGNPSPSPFIINFNKAEIHHGIGLLKKYTKNQ